MLPEASRESRGKGGETEYLEHAQIQVPEEVLDPRSQAVGLAAGLERHEIFRVGVLEVGPEDGDGARFALEELVEDVHAAPVRGADGVDLDLLGDRLICPPLGVRVSHQFWTSSPRRIEGFWVG